MPVTVVVGAQWGDEGKAKVIDLLAKEHPVVAPIKVVTMQVTPLSLAMKSTRCNSRHQACFTTPSRQSLRTVWSSICQRCSTRSIC